MAFWNRLLSLYRNLTSNRAVESDLDQELRAYLDQLTDQHLRSGMSAAEARRAARLELGGLDQVKEAVRDTRQGRQLEEIRRDLVYGLRALRGAPAFTVATILVLALGIGACTAIFSVAYGVLVRPLPYPQADRILLVGMHFYPRDFEFGTMSLRDFEHWTAGNRAFEETAIFSSTRLDIGGEEGPPEQVRGALVTSGFFRALRTPPVLGRTFAPGEDAPNGPSLIVIGETLWRRRFNANPAVIGESILVGSVPYTVIGVAPRTVGFPHEETQAWINLKLVPPTRYGPWFYRGIARLKPGVSRQQAQAETNAIARRIEQLNPTYQRLTLPALPIREWIIGDPRIRKALAVLIGAVALVLLIAVVNVANLMLARGTVREREMVLRLSLGAGRARIVRQLLVESTLLAIAGGASGMLLAWGAIALLRAWNPSNLSLIDSVRLDLRALVFTLAVSAAAGILAGLFPALDVSRAEWSAALKEGGRGGTSGRRRHRTRSLLVTLEVTLSLMLLIGAGLLLRSLSRLEQVSGGFQAPVERLWSAVVSPGDPRYKDPSLGLPFYDEAIRRVRRLPGIQTAAVADALPPDRQGDADSFEIEGQPLGPNQINPIVSDITVSPGYFETLQIPLVRGRFFDEHDTTDSTPVVIISRNMERRFFPHLDPVGKRIRRSGDTWMQIVGIVGDVKYLGRRDQESDAAYYMPLRQGYLTPLGQAPRLFLVVRAEAGDMGALARRVERAVQSANSAATVASPTTMRHALESEVAEPRLDAALLGFFAAIALLLAAVGSYGLIAYAVAQRTREIGIRMALGARPGDVLRLVARQGAALALAGIVLGMAGALALSRLLNALLFGVTATDPAAFLAAPLALAAVVIAAAILPACRAARISPLDALRQE